MYGKYVGWKDVGLSRSKGTKYFLIDFFTDSFLMVGSKCMVFELVIWSVR